MKENKQVIKNAIQKFMALQAREINPVGTFDNAGRWYPDVDEKCDCCKSVRSPSRAYPYSLMLHCRSLRHICTKYELDYKEVKKVMNSEKPKRKIQKQIMYKKCAWIDGDIKSIYNNETYERGRTYIDKAKSNHQGGYYCYSTVKEAINAVFPTDSINSDCNKKAIVRVEMWGNSIDYSNGKKAFSYMKIIEIVYFV